MLYLMGSAETFAYAGRAVMELYFYALDSDVNQGPGWLEADIEDVIFHYENYFDSQFLDYAFEDEEGNYIKLKCLPDYMRAAFIERLDLQGARRNKAANDLNGVRNEIMRLQYKIEELRIKEAAALAYYEKVHSPETT